MARSNNGANAVVPFYDLSRQDSEVKSRVRGGIRNLVRDSMFIAGPNVEEFERNFARSLGVQHVLGVGNGSDALELAFRALGLPPGSEVLVPANSFIATANAAVRAGLSVKFVRFDTATGLVSAEHFEEMYSSKVGAVVPVHLFGQMADMGKIIDFARRNNIFVVEDMAQAQGATQNGVSSGAWGDIAATSFYPSKNLGAWGDAGAVVTNSLSLAQKVAELRNYGGTRRYEHQTIGFNSRLDPIQAIVLNAKLDFLEEWNELRRGIARQYSENLSENPAISVTAKIPSNKHVFHLYTIRVADRARLMSLLTEAGIGYGVHYPALIPDTPAYRTHEQFHHSSFSQERDKQNQLISLPLFPHMSRRQVEKVVQVLARYGDLEAKGRSWRE